MKALFILYAVVAGCLGVNVCLLLFTAISIGHLLFSRVKLVTLCTNALYLGVGGFLLPKLPLVAAIACAVVAVRLGEKITQERGSL